MGFSNLAAQGQADAGAMLLRRVEGHESTRVDGQSGAVIIHADLKPVDIETPTDGDPVVASRVSLLARLHGVGDHIDQQFLQLILIGPDSNGRSLIASLQVTNSAADLTLLGIINRADVIYA